MHPDKIDDFRSNLLKWYGKYRRSLPWRSHPTPYRVWISEIMLQQTQVTSAVPYYNRFLKRFPDIKSLACASEDEILAHWSGLGYYNRARNLHKAARQISEFHGGVFPEDYKTVLSLPGIGRYTAGAICSIAFNQAQPVVDGNIRRVIARLAGIRGRIPEKYFWDRMSEWVPEKKASFFNQAMMELGATVCVPSQPICDQCPVHTYCVAKRKKIQNSIPPAKPGKEVLKVDLVLLVVKYGRRVLLTRQENSFIPGEWGLPLQSVQPGQSESETAKRLSRKLFKNRVKPVFVTTVKHGITHHGISAHIFTGKATGAVKALLKEEDGVHWANDLQTSAMLTSSLFLKALQICRR